VRSLVRSAVLAAMVASWGAVGHAALATAGSEDECCDDEGRDCAPFCGARDGCQCCRTLRAALGTEAPIVRSPMTRAALELVVQRAPADPSPRERLVVPRA
jgi:hypothetical protein